MARDLHDTVGQTLAALKMGLAALENRLRNTRFTNTQFTTDMLTELAALTDQAIKEIRTRSYLLHPPLLDEVGTLYLILTVLPLVMLIFWLVRVRVIRKSGFNAIARASETCCAKLAVVRVIVGG